MVNCAAPATGSDFFAPVGTGVEVTYDVAGVVPVYVEPPVVVEVGTGVEPSARSAEVGVGYVAVEDELDGVCVTYDTGTLVGATDVPEPVGVSVSVVVVVVVLEPLGVSDVDVLESAGESGSGSVELPGRDESAGLPGSSVSVVVVPESGEAGAPGSPGSVTVMLLSSGGVSVPGSIVFVPGVLLSPGVVAVPGPSCPPGVVAVFPPMVFRGES